MSLKGKSGAKAALLAAILGIELFGSSCGDYFRPVANPILQPGGDPQRTAHALVVSSKGSSPGTAVIIDVSGDTTAAIFSDNQGCPKCGVGRNPVYATNLSGTDYVVNRDDDSVAAFTLLGVGNPPNIISLPVGASPVFAAPAGGKLFVAEPGLGNQVADVTPASLAPSAQLTVGHNPVALVATPDNTKLYCLNHDDSSVSVIFPATDQVITTIQLAPTGGTSPVRGAVSSDGTRVFVVNQGSNNVSVIDTASDTVISTLPVGLGPNYITYEASLNRAYVTSPAGNSLSIIDNNTGTVQTVSLAGPPCNAQQPISVTALADGTRVYVADDVTSSVCVLNTTSNTFTKRICLVQEPTPPAAPAAPCVGSATPVFIASNSDATRVYTANQYQTAPFAIASISRQNNTDPTTGLTTGVVTVTTAASNPFVAGQPVTIAGVSAVSDPDYPGVFGITHIISSTQFQYVQDGLPNSSSTGGTATILPYISLIQTAGDTLLVVHNSDGTTPPLTIDAGGTPVFIAMTP